MRARSALVIGLLLVSQPHVVVAAETSTATPASALHERIEALTGLKGKWNEQEGVFKVSFPPTDLHVKGAGGTMTPQVLLGGSFPYCHL